jgi:hypothetical protein
MQFLNLTGANLRDYVAPWIAEDIPSFDVGGYVVGK